MSESKPKGWMRDAMPTCAEWIDDLRATFGADQVDPSIRAGMAGMPNKFWSTEGCNTIGTPFEG